MKDDAELRSRAARASASAYAKYSGVKVGAAVRLKDGAVFTGANVENASYGLTVCAERVAIFNAVNDRGPEVRVEAIALFSDDPRVTSPCGACRQVLYEFGSDAVVLLPDGTSARVSQLLPRAFGVSDT